MFDHEYSQQDESTSPSRTSTSSHAWERLARAAYELDDPRATPAVDGRELAQAVADHAPERLYYSHLERAFAALAAELRDDRSPEADRVRARVTEFTSALPQDLLRAILGASGEAARRRDLLDAAAAGFDVDALLHVVFAAAAEAGFELTQPLERLLRKLAEQTRLGPPELRARADAALRGQVESLIARWWLVRTDAMSYGFDEMFQSEVVNSAIAPEPDRMVHIAIEVDAVGLPIWGPLAQMLGDGRFRELLDLLRGAPRESTAARAIIGHAATPQRLGALLAEDDVDFESVDRLIDRMGELATPLLLDRLATAESRAVRRGVFDRLVRLGPGVGPAAWERLSDPRWFVQRNLLALLGELEYWPDGAPIDDWIRHPDPRLRKEAIRALLRMPKQRERALLHALRDEHDRPTLRIVIATAQQHTPEAAVPILVKRLGDEQLPPDLRIAALRLLGFSRSALALEALLRFVEGGRSMLGRPKLAPKSPEMLAALRALAVRWSGERRVAPLLERARESKDADIARAATGAGGNADMLPPGDMDELRP